MDPADDNESERRRKAIHKMAAVLAHALPSPRAERIVVSRDGAGSGPLAELAQALGRRPDDEEAVAWATMSLANREATLNRIRLLQRWVGDRGELTAASAASQAGLGLSRWYDVAGRWSSGERRLFDIGRYARGHPDRKGVFDATLLDELRTAVPRIVAENDGLDGRRVPVARMVELLVQSIDVGARRLPVFNTLRRMIEQERRRVDTRGQVGTQLGFDMVGSGLLRSDGRQHLIYGVIDRTSRLILGFTLGSIENSVERHGVAAIDALAGISSIGFDGVPWATATRRIDVVPGMDVDAWSLRAQRRKAPVEWGIADGRKSRGGYFRKAVGPHLGRLKLSSVRNAIELRDIAPEAEVFNEDSASLRISVEVASHNSAVMAELRELAGEGEAAPAPTLEAALRWVSGG